jgi:hypothetical protein
MSIHLCHCAFNHLSVFPFLHSNLRQINKEKLSLVSFFGMVVASGVYMVACGTFTAYKSMYKDFTFVPKRQGASLMLHPQ